MEIRAFLFATYMREMNIHGLDVPGRYDGASVFDQKSVRVVLGCDGKDSPRQKVADL